MSALNLARIHSALVRCGSGAGAGGETVVLEVLPDRDTWLRVQQGRITARYPFEDEPLGRLERLGLATLPQLACARWQPGESAEFTTGPVPPDTLAVWLASLLRSLYGLGDAYALEARVEPA